MAALDERLQAVLEDVKLAYLLEREGGWDVTANWEDMLSLGEQQRLGMVRPGRPSCLERKRDTPLELPFPIVCGFLTIAAWGSRVLLTC